MHLKIFKTIDKSELIHFNEGNLVVSSYAGQVTITNANHSQTKINLPLPLYHKLFRKLRIFRRLLRIDKINVEVINKKSLLLLFFI